MRNFFVKSISNSYHLSNLPQMKNMLFRCEHMISKSVLNTGIFEKLREIASMYYFNFAILIVLTKPLINRIFLSPLHFWTKISCNQLFPNKLHNGNLLSLTHFGKNFVKATFLIYREMLNSWFDEIFFLWKWEIFFQYYFAKNPRNRSIYLCMPFSLHFFLVRVKFHNFYTVLQQLKLQIHSVEKW